MDIWQIVRDIGVFASVVAAAIGYWVRIRVEQKRLLRKVLYYLLELRYSARFLAGVPKEYIKVFNEEYFAEWKRHGIDLTDEVSKEEYQKLLDYAANKAAKEKAALPVDFIPSFYSALDALSERYPIKAYQLRGSQDLKALLDFMDSINNEVIAVFKEVEGSKKMINIIKQTQEVIKEAEFKHELKSLDDLIKGVAWKCGIPQRRYIRDVLKNLQWDFTSLDQKRIKDLVKIALDSTNTIDLSNLDKPTQGVTEDTKLPPQSKSIANTQPSLQPESTSDLYASSVASGKKIVGDIL